MTHPELTEAEDKVMAEVTHAANRGAELERARFFGFSTMAVSASKTQQVAAYGVSLSWLQVT